jgi:hypothetical protein
MQNENQVLAILGIEKAVVSKVNDPAAVKAVNEQTKVILAESVLTPAHKLLIAKSNELEPSTLKKWENNGIEFFDAVKYVRKDVSLLAGSIDIFTDSLDKEPGITNFTKARLDSNENLMLERIELNYDRGTGITTKTADLAPIVSSDDNAIFNGEVEIQVGGKTIAKIPVSSFSDAPKGQNAVEKKCNGFNLSSPKLIKEGEEIQIRLITVGTIASSSDKDIIEFKLLGAATRSR